MYTPQEPDEADCCGSGCSPCIFDIYQQQLDHYNQLTSKKSTTTLPTSKNCIAQTSYSIFRVTDIQHESKNTYLYTFKYVKQNTGVELEENGRQLSYLPGQHFLLRAEDVEAKNKYFTRAYTPIFKKNTDTKTFTVLIKLYENGKMSEFIKTLVLNSETCWRGPFGGYELSYDLKNILMICQGTGVAPFYTIVNKIIDNEDCDTFLKLLYCCKDSQSIHLRNELYDLASFWNFTYEIFLSDTQDEFHAKYNEKIHNRRLEKTDIDIYVRNIKNGDKFHVLICGSELFNENILNSVINCGVSKKCAHVF